MDLTPARFASETTSELAHPLTIGTIVDGRYKVRKLLGHGGFGAVYLVEHIEDGSLAALKTLLDPSSLSLAQKHAFNKEAKVWLSLANHPFIVKLHHVLIADGRMSVVMEYIPPDGDGLVTLFDHIAWTPEGIADQQLGQWAIQFCHAMEHGASKGLVAHRDIKPLNILIEPCGFLKVSDFGLASALGSVLDAGASIDRPVHASAFETQDGRICCGTPGFISPELYGNETASVESDIFSFGVVLWQMAAGSNNVPYSVSYQGNLFDFQRSLLALQLRHAVIHVDSIYWDVISKCLHPDPRQRFASFSQLRDDIKSVMKAAGLRVMDFLINAEGLVEFKDLVNKGASFSLLAQHSKALEYLNRALEQDPESVEALVNRGNNWSRMGRDREALTDYVSALSISPDFYPALIGRSDCYADAGDLRSALADIEQALILKPASPAALYRRGLLLGMTGRAEEAVVDMDRAVTLNPHDAKLWTHFGTLLRNTGAVDAAINCFSEAISKNKWYLPAYLGKGRALLAQGKRPEALAFFKDTLVFFEPDIGALNVIGIEMSDAGAPSEAIEVFDSIMMRDPSQAHILLCNIGNAHLELGNDAAAIQNFRRSMKADAFYVLPHLRLADTLAGAGSYSASIEFYDSAAELDPSNFDAWFGGGSSRLLVGDADAAATCITKGLALQQRNAHAWYNLAVANATLGRLNDCRDCLEKAVEYEPTYARAWYLKTQIEMREGERKIALHSCIQANQHAAALDRNEANNVAEWLAELTAKDPE